MIKQTGFIHVYNKIAPLYDTVFGRNCCDAYSLVLALIEKHGIPIHSLLDVGCGTGTFFQFISDKIFVEQLYGIDPSENMIKIAQNKKIDQCKFFTEFIEDLSLPDGSVDCVISTTAFSHFGDVQMALRQIHRVLKKSGHCIIIEHQKPNLLVAIFLRMFRLLANYRDIEEIKPLFIKSSFRLVELRGTKKYIVAHIVPIGA